MSNAESFAERLILGDHAVEGFHLTDQCLEPRINEAGAVGAEALGVEGGTQFHESEAASQRVVEHREATVCRVHHADNVDVAGNVEELTRIEELELILRSAFITLDEHEQLAKDLGEVSTVDLVNDEEVGVLLVLGSLLTERVKGPLHQLESRTRGAIPLNEVLVGVALVELDQHDPRGVLDAHHRVGEAFGGEGLTHAGCALQDNVLLGAQDAHGCVIAFLVHEDLVEELFGGILREDRQRFLIGN